MRTEIQINGAVNKLLGWTARADMKRQELQSMQEGKEVKAFRLPPREAGMNDIEYRAMVDAFSDMASEGLELVSI